MTTAFSRSSLTSHHPLAQESPDRDRKRSYEEFRGTSIEDRIKDLEVRAGRAVEQAGGVTPMSKSKRSRV